MKHGLLQVSEHIVRHIDSYLWVRGMFTFLADLFARTAGQHFAIHNMEASLRDS